MSSVSCELTNQTKTETANFFSKGTVIINYVKHFLVKAKLYRHHSELISKYNVGLKPSLQEGWSEPDFYGDLVFKSE